MKKFKKGCLKEFSVKLTAVLLCSAMTFAVLPCNKAKADSFFYKASKVSYETEKLKKKYEKGPLSGRIYAKYPVFDSQNPVYEKINENSLKEAEKFIKQNYKDIVEMVDIRDKDIKEASKEDPEYVPEKEVLCEGKLDCSVKYYGKDYLSIEYSYVVYLGGAWYCTPSGHYGITYDLKNGNIVPLNKAVKGKLKPKVLKGAKRFYKKYYEKNHIDAPYPIDFIATIKEKDYEYYIDKKGNVIICLGKFDMYTLDEPIFSIGKSDLIK